MISNHAIQGPNTPTTQVKNPSSLPNDNTWQVLVTKDQSEIRFSHVLAGYTFGARSPEELGTFRKTGPYPVPPLRPSAAPFRYNY